MTISARVRIHGKVQGVWFRGWTMAEATRLGINGWVRNRFDGSVEAVFSGPEAAVREMVALCRRGPDAAQVDRVEESVEPGPVEPGFAQLATG
jgi:acylphosphatase